MSWRALGGLAELAGEADLFLVDQFGTLHDGTRGYADAREGLDCLREGGARVAILSNSGRRAPANAERLATLGFPPESYDFLLTSGDVAWQQMARDAGGACLVLSRVDDPGFFDGLPWRVTEDAAAADLVLIAGSRAERVPLDDYAERLAPAARRRVPCVCTNPDRTMLVPGGTAPGSGRIAELYRELGGGPITWIGKPHPAIYRAAFAALGIAAGSRVIAVGDSLEHDVAGAVGAGCRAALVRTGIADGLDDAALRAEAAKRGAASDFILRRFAP